jgi:DNA-binding MarR family transcriptional regulator
MASVKSKSSRKNSDHLDRWIPAHLLRLGNGMSRSASRLYLAMFGVGVIEWRILSILSYTSYVTAQTICDEIALDRAAASRSIHVLEERGLVRVADDVTDNRKRPITMTTAGKALHDQIYEIASKRVRLLMRGFSQEETETLLAMFRRMAVNLQEVVAHDEGLIAVSQKGSRKQDEKGADRSRRDALP